MEPNKFNLGQEVWVEGYTVDSCVCEKCGDEHEVVTPIPERVTVVGIEIDNFGEDQYYSYQIDGTHERFGEQELFLSKELCEKDMSARKRL